MVTIKNNSGDKYTVTRGVYENIYKPLGYVIFDNKVETKIEKKVEYKVENKDFEDIKKEDSKDKDKDKVKTYNKEKGDSDVIRNK